MATQSILVRIPGYPFCPEALMPDRELAALGGVLLDNGHATSIRDYGTVDFLERVYPDEARESAVRLVDRFSDSEGQNPLMVLHTVWQVRSADRAYQARQEQVCAEIADELAGEGAVDFVAFKLDCADDLRGITLIASRLRSLKPELALVAFGPLVDLYAGSLAEMTDVFDCFCVGDGEVAIAALAERIHDREAWSRVPNLVFSRSGKTVRTPTKWLEDLGKASASAYDSSIYGALAGDAKLKLFELEDSRGCGSSCYACPRPLQESGLRMKPARAVCDEMADLGTLHGAQAFHVRGEGTPMMHAGAVAQALISLGMCVSYSRTANLPSAQPSTFPTLRKSGCHALSFRVDTGSQRLLSGYYGRDLSVSSVEGVLRESRQAGLFTLAGITFPCPEDDEHTLAETLRMISRAKPHAAPVALAEAVPGSLWHRQPWRFGIKNPKERAEAISKRRTRFPLPPGRWESPGGSVGSMSAGQAMQSRESLLNELESMEVLGAVSPQLALMAHCLGWADRMGEFRNRMEREFLTGDIDAVAGTVSEYNERVSTRVAANLWHDEQLSAAAGN
jgi:hypothetical protein